MQKLLVRYVMAIVLVSFLNLLCLCAESDIPDLTQGAKVDRERTYNLGATGLRGWIYSKPETHFDGLQGRTTALSRQILVTHVGVKSPADGVIQVGDVILGVHSKNFTDDARKSLAYAIQEAEKESSGGLLPLVRWREGKTENISIRLRVLGTYSNTAPYDCAKSTKILEEACKVLESEALPNNWHGAISGLALLATGKSEYLPQLKKLAHGIASAKRKTERIGMGTWEIAYQNLFLCEYFLATDDRVVFPAIEEFTIALAKGQSMYGTFGHGFAERAPDGNIHGSIPPYGPVNQAGLPANLSIVMGKKCGVVHEEIDPAIDRASRFFGYFVDKGTIPYGEHEPWPFHDNNGKSAMSAVFFAIQSEKHKESQFFSKMTVASYRSRECGHTGQGFSYLWGALGASMGGPNAASAFFREASWHFDLVRRCDGSFTYDGGEQYGPGETEDDTYYGNSSYYDLSPAATYVLTYAIPLRKIYLTGRDLNPKLTLSSEDIQAAVRSGRFDTERKEKSTAELIDQFGDWSPVVRSWAAEEIVSRSDAKDFVPKLMALVENGSQHQRQGACETLGNLKVKKALPIFIGLLSDQDRWLRYKAAQAIRTMGVDARESLSEILAAVATTAEPMKPIQWDDPVQLTHGQLAAALFQGPLTASLKNSDPKLLYPAIRAIATNADGMARATLREFFENELTLEDVQSLAPEIYQAVKTPSPADTMFGNEIRMGGFKALTKYQFKEAIAIGVLFAKTQSGHGSENRTGEIMEEIAKYGAAARPVIPQLNELIDEFNLQCERGKFPAGELNDRRVNAVKAAIKAIEDAKDSPELRTIGNTKILEDDGP